ncbi:MAG: enoyl-CoA hydratase-related protein [Actinomycetota bacterium]
MSEASALPADDVLLSELRGTTLLITLNRPTVHNSIDGEIQARLGDELELADRDQQIRAIVLTGAGDRAFCAGGDLRALARGELNRPPGDQWGFAGYVTHAISKPTIAAVNGFALGGGLELVLASDLAIAAERATFGLPEVSHGVLAGGGGAIRMPRQVPQKVANEMILTGQPITAHRAYELGLVNRVVPNDEVVAAALELADSIGANAPLATQASKRVARGIVEGRYLTEDEEWRRSDSELAVLMASEDAREGVAAFAERRSPRWKSR